MQGHGWRGRQTRCAGRHSTLGRGWRMKRAEGSSHCYVGQRVDEGRRTSRGKDLPGAYHLLVETGVGGGGVAKKMGGGRSEKLVFLRRSQGGGRGIGRARTSIGIHHALRPKPGARGAALDGPDTLRYAWYSPNGREGGGPDISWACGQAKRKGNLATPRSGPGGVTGRRDGTTNFASEDEGKYFP